MISFSDLYGPWSPASLLKLKIPSRFTTDKSHTIILILHYNFLNPELNKILGKSYFNCISISSKFNQDIWITGYAYGSSKKASQCKAGARTLGPCTHVITGLALCFDLSHHVKDPQRGPSDIASLKVFCIYRKFWTIKRT